MSQEFISKEVTKIVEGNDYEYPLNLAMGAAWICGNFKGHNLKVLKVAGMSSLADYFVLASASNVTQAKAMAEAVLVELKKHGAKSLSKEGMPQTDWMLLDLGDIIVHIFLDISREVYDLDGLWRDAQIMEIPQEYYYSSDEANAAGATEKKEEKDFF